MKVIFKPLDKEVKVARGTSILKAAQEAGLRLESDCGGTGRCGKCKVKVHKGVTPMGPRERDLLTPQEVKDKVRLACQALITAPTTVALMTPAPGKERILEEGIGRFVATQPAIKKCYLEIKADDLKKDGTITEIIEDLLFRHGIKKTTIAFAGLKTLPVILDQNRSGVTALLKNTEVIGFEPGDTSDHIYGLAVDIGTTTVVGYLFDLSRGKLMGVDSGLNGQSVFGSDVITRIEHALNSPEGLNQLQEAVSGTINGIIENLCFMSRISSNNIYSLVIVGNTPMNHLFWGMSPRFLSRFPYNPLTTRALCVPSGGLGIEMNTLGRVFALPLVSGFIGSDTVGVVLATDLHKSKVPRIAIDIGTNGEIVLAAGKTVVACSCAAGPAFEGSHIQCGMRGASGAIDQVLFTGDEIQYHVIDEVPPQGICGSGLVDAVAGMLKCGLITVDGRLLTQEEISNRLYATRIRQGKYNLFSLTGQEAIPPGGEEVVITQKDIRELQLAKGAMMAGIKILIDRVGLLEQDIREVYLAGAFGNYIRPENAVAIGLLPQFKNAKVVQVGNAAGSGAKMALLSTKAFNQATRIAAQIEYIEIAKVAVFQEEFIKGMVFPTWI
ncbi:MAG: DUF4445 domain-containing protein [Deltaproteobacteria bacterium]|nr:DUF4445 domain-containing protein [Deltaproteobacteria bacterium]